MDKADIAVIGLAVMGQNLILNMLEKGFVVCVYNRTVSKVDDFLANEGKGLRALGAHSLSELAEVLKKPRRIMLMVKAGQPVDAMISSILPFLDRGDIIIDGGNSEYTDTARRCTELKEKNIRFVGCGVSGGEEGARHGPSLMPGGSAEAWPYIKDIFQAIAAKVDNEPCCDWVGENGAGHFVKMVHNGIEYGDMQLIAEAYSLLKDGADLTHDEMAEVFAEWNKGALDSYLIEITSHILKFKDENKQTLLPNIRDAAGQKGTGKWTGIVALNYGIPLTLIGEAVFARCLSSLKDDRLAAAKVLPGPNPDKAVIQALYASKIISYAQGFMLLAEANRVFKWNLNFGSIALMWRGGCIIRSRFLGEIKKAYDTNPKLSNLLMDSFFLNAIRKCQESWRIISAAGILLGIPTPAFSTALAFYDGFRCKVLPANLIQAQRDYFGAHMYELMDKPGTFLHTNWTGTGGNVTSTAYIQ
uniref:6-phosphogluconate dehydrogenase, decarboxylating n=1 Tax=Brugia malayi TaxID=6279 RepID=A0A1I9G2U1_BRUMA|nr:Bm13964, isoform b [Brugia malayi]